MSRATVWGASRRPVDRTIWHRRGQVAAAPHQGMRSGSALQAAWQGAGHVGLRRTDADAFIGECCDEKGRARRSRVGACSPAGQGRSVTSARPRSRTKCRSTAGRSHRPPSLIGSRPRSSMAGFPGPARPSGFSTIRSICRNSASGRLVWSIAASILVESHRSESKAHTSVAASTRARPRPRGWKAIPPAPAEQRLRR